MIRETEMERKRTMGDEIETCTLCGEACDELTIVDDETRVCASCLDSYYTQCDVCGEYWADDAIEMTATEDGRLVCEHCMEDLEED